MHKTKIMGILNVTPDSFSDKGKYYGIESAIERGVQLAEEGADILDIGGESTRPGSLPISIEEELARVVPVVKALKKVISIPISIDTKKPEVALHALQAGATILNDVSGFSQIEMCQVAKDAKAPICVMHMHGTPETMQNDPSYSEDIVDYLLSWFQKKIETLLSYGIEGSNIILDPGIGFGKTVEDNKKIIQNLRKFKDLGYPVLLGVSRKSFMTKIVGKSAENLLNETLIVNTLAYLQQVDIIRVHDVKEHRSMITLLEAII